MKSGRSSASGAPAAAASLSSGTAAADAGGGGCDGRLASLAAAVAAAAAALAAENSSNRDGDASSTPSDFAPHRMSSSSVEPHGEAAAAGADGGGRAQSGHAGAAHPAATATSRRKRKSTEIEQTKKKKSRMQRIQPRMSSPHLPSSVRQNHQSPPYHSDPDSDTHVGTTTTIAAASLARPATHFNSGYERSVQEIPAAIVAHMQPSAALTPQRTASILVHPDDARDQVLLAVVKTLVMLGNRPSTPKELATFILTHRLVTLGHANVLNGKTPYATVSSRISQHLRRCVDAGRQPIIGKVPIIGSSHTSGTPRKWRYYIDVEGVSVPSLDLPISISASSTVTQPPHVADTRSVPSLSTASTSSSQSTLAQTRPVLHNHITSQTATSSMSGMEVLDQPSFSENIGDNPSIPDWSLQTCLPSAGVVHQQAFGDHSEQHNQQQLPKKKRQKSSRRHENQAQHAFSQPDYLIDNTALSRAVATTHVAELTRHHESVDQSAHQSDNEFIDIETITPEDDHTSIANTVNNSTNVVYQSDATTDPVVDAQDDADIVTDSDLVTQAHTLLLFSSSHVLLPSVSESPSVYSIVQNTRNPTPFVNPSIVPGLVQRHRPCDRVDVADENHASGRKSKLVKVH